MLVMLMGLPASGKSTKVRELKDMFENKFGQAVTVLSSDNIREEICGDMTDQSKNKQVFEILYSRMEQLLANNECVIFDATNITIENRKQAISLGKQYNNRISLYFMNTSLEKCLLRNSQRDRQVPPRVIKRMSRQLQFPTKEEGFDYIEIAGCN